MSVKDQPAKYFNVPLLYRTFGILKRSSFHVKMNGVRSVNMDDIIKLVRAAEIQLLLALFCKQPNLQLIVTKITELRRSLCWYQCFCEPSIDTVTTICSVIDFDLADPAVTVRLENMPVFQFSQSISSILQLDQNDFLARRHLFE